MKQVYNPSGIVLTQLPATSCRSPRVSKGDTLDIEHIALAYARDCAPLAGKILQQDADHVSEPGRESSDRECFQTGTHPARSRPTALERADQEKRHPRHDA